MLPAATSAYGKVIAAWNHTYLSGCDHVLDTAVGIAFAFFYEPDVGHVAGSGKWNEDHHAVDTGEGITFGGDVGYFNMLQYRELLAFS